MHRMCPPYGTLNLFQTTMPVLLAFVLGWKRHDHNCMAGDTCHERGQVNPEDVTLSFVLEIRRHHSCDGHKTRIARRVAIPTCRFAAACAGGRRTTGLDEDCARKV